MVHVIRRARWSGTSNDLVMGGYEQRKVFFSRSIESFPLGLIAQTPSAHWPTKLQCGHLAPMRRANSREQERGKAQLTKISLFVPSNDDRWELSVERHNYP